MDQENFNLDGLTNEIELLKQLSSNRDELDNMLETVSKTREQVFQLFPATTDARGKLNRFALEMRLKSVSTIFDTELSIRKEKNNSIKLELDIRKKLFGTDENEDQQDRIDKLTEALESLERKNTKKTHPENGDAFECQTQSL